MYEGAPNWPAFDRFWAIIEKHKVNTLYTAPTAIRTFIKWGDEWPKKHDLSSLRLLGTVGEPINPEAWMWYREVIGGNKLSHRRYLVADRDRHDHDYAYTRRSCHQAWFRNTSVPRDLGRGRDPQRRARPTRIGRIPRIEETVAGDASHRL